MAGVLFPIHVTLSFLELRESKQKSNDFGARKHSHPAYEQSLINTVRAGRRQPETDLSAAVDSASGEPGFVLKDAFPKRRLRSGIFGGYKTQLMIRSRYMSLIILS